MQLNMPVLHIFRNKKLDYENCFLYNKIRDLFLRNCSKDAKIKLQLL